MSLRRIFLGLLTGITLLVISVMALIYFGQDKLIYHPQPYPVKISTLLATKESPYCTINYRTSQGAQTAFYCPPKNGANAKHLWVMFNGNASLSYFTWPDLIQQDANHEDAFLLIDYPGYGECTGQPSPKTIEESADASLLALQQQTGKPLPQLRVIGHSLGAAAAMQFAANHEVDRVILLSPFTSIHDMGKLMFHFAPKFLIRHDFDNSARLDQLANRNNPPHVIILHGANDEVIPVQMGHALAARHPLMTKFQELPDTHHNDILNETTIILDAMNSQ